MNNEILNKANMYADGLARVQARRAHWLEKHEELKTHLKEIADVLNANATYRQGFFVDTMHAFIDEINGTCAGMPSITLRTGDMPLMVSFRNNMGGYKDYVEYGFRLTFAPTITGEIVVLLYPHYNDLNKQPPQYATLGVISDIAAFTMENADELVQKAIEAAYYSSFTGVAELSQNDQPPQAPLPPHHNPIGFKRFETTEKVH